jgi:hypothetical protein
MRIARQSLIKQPQRGVSGRRVTLLGDVQKQRGRDHSGWEHGGTVAMNDSTAAEQRAGLRRLHRVRRLGQGTETMGDTIRFIPGGMAR